MLLVLAELVEQGGCSSPVRRVPPERRAPPRGKYSTARSRCLIVAAPPDPPAARIVAAWLPGRNQFSRLKRPEKHDLVDPVAAFVDSSTRLGIIPARAERDEMSQRTAVISSF